MRLHQLVAEITGASKVLPSAGRDIERGGGDDDDGGGRAATTSSQPQRPNAPPDSIIRRRKPLKLLKNTSTWPAGVRSPFLEYFTRRAEETDRPFCVFLTWNSGDGHRGIDIPVDDPQNECQVWEDIRIEFQKRRNPLWKFLTRITIAPARVRSLVFS